MMISNNGWLASMLPRFLGFAFLFAVMLPLAGCNTTAGLGEDLEAAGDSIEDTAEESQ